MSQNISIEEVIRAIVLQAGLSREDINKKINDTIATFNGLLTPVGAALIIAAVLFVRLSLKIRSSPPQSLWHAVGIGLMGSIVAGAVFACYDVTFSGTLATAAGYIYFSIPLLWIILALFIVSCQKLSLPDQLKI